MKMSDKEPIMKVPPSEPIIRVPSSDEVHSGSRRGIVSQESRRDGTSQLVVACDAPATQQGNVATQEHSEKNAHVSMVDDHGAKTIHMNSDSQEQSYIQRKHIKVSDHGAKTICVSRGAKKQSNCQGKHIKVLKHGTKTTRMASYARKPKWKLNTNPPFSMRYKLTLFLYLLAGCPDVTYTDQTCDKVLKASHVESIASNNLDFSSGQFKSTEEGAFAGASTAEILNLSNNCLQIVPGDAFSNMTSLFDVDLSNNNFRNIPRALHNVSSLRNLNIRNNCILYLGKDDLKGKGKMNKMNFDNNGMEGIHDAALDHLTCLRIANFSRNELTALPRFNLTEPDKLVLLDFRNNKLIRLHILHFSKFTEVTSITITDAKMTLNKTKGRSEEFLIGGNSGTLSCEENLHDICNSKLDINYTFHCQDNNRVGHQLKGFHVYQNGTTAGMSCDTFLNDGTTGIVSSDIFLNDSTTAVKPSIISKNDGSVENDPAPCGNGQYLAIIFLIILLVLSFLCYIFCCCRKGSTHCQNKTTTKGEKKDVESKNGPTLIEMNDRERGANSP